MKDVERNRVRETDIGLRQRTAYKEIEIEGQRDGKDRERHRKKEIEIQGQRNGKDRERYRKK